MVPADDMTPVEDTAVTAVTTWFIGDVFKITGPGGQWRQGNTHWRPGNWQPRAYTGPPHYIGSRVVRPWDLYIDFSATFTVLEVYEGTPFVAVRVRVSAGAMSVWINVQKEGKDWATKVVPGGTGVAVGDPADTGGPAPSGGSGSASLDAVDY